MRRALLTWTLLCACAPVPPATSPPEAPPPAPIAIAEPTPEAQEADADAIVARVLVEVARLRELAVKGKVKGETVGRQQMVEQVRQQIRREIPAPVMLAQNDLLFALGVVPASFDYEKSVLELMGTQLAGFYEPRSKTMYLAEDLVGMERHATLAHELVHALQDQHYDLGAKIKFKEDATDAQSAVHALAEGDATSAMLDQMLMARGMKATDLSDSMISLEARGGIEMAPDAAGVPSLLKRSVVSPYVDGVELVHWARRRGGWAAVDAIWRKPPVSTEQLLHPDKYLAGEAPEVIALPVAPKKGPNTVIYRDVLGEQSVRIVLEEWMPRRSAVEAAAGWAGDRIAVFRDGERAAMAWRLRWDDEKGAQRGATAFARGVLARKGEVVSGETAARELSGGHLCRERRDAGPFAVLRQARDVVLVAGPFRRSGATAHSDAGCGAAVAWARAVVAKK